MATASVPDHHFWKRTPHLQLYRRQLGDCTSQCAPLLPGGNCTTADCVCPIVNAAGATAVNSCVNCISATDPSLASNITLTADVCMHCQSQCSSGLTAYFQSLGCNSSTLACICAPFIPLGATTIATCANCLEPLDQAYSSGLIEIGQECGILPSNVTSATLSASASATSTSVATPTASAQSSTGSASPAATASKSAATHVEFDTFGSLVWIALTLTTVVFAFLFV